MSNVMHTSRLHRRRPVLTPPYIVPAHLLIESMFEQRSTFQGFNAVLGFPVSDYTYLVKVSLSQEFFQLQVTLW